MIKDVVHFTIQDMGGKYCKIILNNRYAGYLLRFLFPMKCLNVQLNKTYD